MFQKGIGIQGFLTFSKVLSLLFILLFNLNESFSMDSKSAGKESEVFVIPISEISRSKVIEISKKCLEKSLYKEQYLVNKFKVHYDKASAVWGVEFKKKSRGEDTCMYGSVIEKNTGAGMCQCLYGL